MIQKLLPGVSVGGEQETTSTPKEKLRRQLRTITIIVAILVVAPVPFTANSYYMRIFNLLLIFAVLTTVTNLLFGHLEMLFLFNGALLGVGAYGTALLAKAFNVSPWLTLPIAAAISGVLGLVVSYTSASLGLGLIALAILSLSLQFIFSEVAIGAREITGGNLGIQFSGLELPILQSSLGVSDEMILYYILIVLFTVVTLAYALIVNSNFRLVFNGVREDELAAESVGIDTTRYKTLFGFLGAFTIGLVGPFYGQLEQYILPSMFTFQHIDVMILIMVVLGGQRTLLGPVVGSAIILGLNQYLLDFGQWRLAIYGLLLSALFLSFREGVIPNAQRAVDKWILSK